MERNEHLGGRTPDGTLGGASGHALEKILHKRQGKGHGHRQQQHPKAVNSVLPQLPQAFNTDGICGAPAGVLDDEEQQNDLRQAGLSRVEDAPAQPVNWAEPEAVYEDEEEWEEASDFEDIVQNARVQEGATGLVILLGDATGTGGSAGKKGLHRFTAEERVAAAWVHQTHLLSLLARGQMYDLAAADPLVQAVALSQLPQQHLQALRGRGMQAAQLTSLVEWFQRTVRQGDEDRRVTPEESQQADLEGAALAAGARLQTVAAQRCGSPEELVVLFVATLRAAGLLVRFVRALDPLPWRPTTKERHVPRQRRPAAERKTAAPEGSKATPKAKRSRDSSQGKARGRGRGRSGRGKPAERSADSEPNISSDDSALLAVGQQGSLLGEETPTTGKNSSRRAQIGSAAGKTRAVKRSAEKTDEAAQHDEQEQTKVGQEEQRRGKGDLEFENQIAMAMMASASSGSTEARAGRPAVAPASRGAALRLLAAKGEGGVGLGATWARGGQRSQVADSWAEIYCDGEDSGQGRWVHVQPLLNWVDKPGLVEGGSVRLSQLAYVVAFAGGGAKDVTSRYVSNMRQAEKLRKPVAKWWHTTLRPLRAAEIHATSSHLSSQTATPPQPNGSPPPSHALTAVDSAKKLRQEVKAKAKREDKELQEKLEKQQAEVPTSLEGFKNHRHYLLQRHLPRYSAIRPGAVKAGLHRGEAYYHSRDVSELHTADKWVQLGREVTPLQLGCPFKVVAKRGSKKEDNLAKDAGDAEAEGTQRKGGGPPEDESQQTKLYGEWQTQPWAAPKAEGGIVPKNERGTVHCPPLAAALPKGTRQITRPRVVAVCKRMGVDYAMAMTGFDIRGSRSVPRFEGVVVCEEFADQVEEEWLRMQREYAEKEAAKRMEGARATWAALLRAIFTRLGLQDANDAPRNSTKATPKKKSKTAAAAEPGSEAVSTLGSDEEADRGGEAVKGRAKKAGAGAAKRKRDATAAGDAEEGGNLQSLRRAKAEIEEI